MDEFKTRYSTTNMLKIITSFTFIGTVTYGLFINNQAILAIFWSLLVLTFASLYKNYRMNFSVEKLTIEKIWFFGIRISTTSYKTSELIYVNFKPKIHSGVQLKPQFLIYLLFPMSTGKWTIKTELSKELIQFDLYESRMGVKKLESIINDRIGELKILHQVYAK